MNFSALYKLTVIAAVMSGHLHAQNERVKNPEVFTKPSISWGESTQDPTASNRGGPATITQAYTVNNGSYTASYYQDEAKPESQTVTATGSPPSGSSEKVSSCGTTNTFAGPEDVTFKVTLTYTDPSEDGGGGEKTIDETKKVAIKLVGRGGGNRTRSDGSVIDGPDDGPPGTVTVPGGGDGGGYHDCFPPFSPGTVPPDVVIDTRKSSTLPAATQLELISENITVNSYKYGWDTYIPTDPPKRFSVKEVITHAEGGDQERPVGGFLAEWINRPDGQMIRIAQVGTPSYYGVPPGGSRTETTLEHSFPVDSYDDCPNERQDTRATMFVSEKIGTEYKTPAFKTAAFDRAFKFKGLGFYAITPAQAKLLVSKNELNLEFKKTKYKFRIPADPIAFPRPFKVSWLEVFTPEDPNPDDDQSPEKTCKAFSEEIGVGQTETQEKTIDPSETPDKEGTWEVIPIEIKFVEPDDVTWQQIMPEKRVVLDDKTLRFKFVLKGLKESRQAKLVEMGFHHLRLTTTGTRPLLHTRMELFGPSTEISIVGESTEIRVKINRLGLKKLDLIPETDKDDVDGERATLDHVTGGTSNFSDSTAFIAVNASVYRGYSKNEEGVSLSNQLFKSKLDKTFIQSAGAETLVVKMEGMTVEGKAMVMNQADVFYYSGHGHSDVGDHGNNPGDYTPGLAALDEEGDGIVRPSDLLPYWSKDLDVAVIAGCAVLNINNWVPFPAYFPPLNGPGVGYWPGKVMENVGPPFLVGYAALAPSDNQGTTSIVTDFMRSYEGNSSAFVSWRDANDNINGRNACAIQRGSKYGYFVRSEFLGISSYSWTEKPKIRDWNP